MTSLSRLLSLLVTLLTVVAATAASRDTVSFGKHRAVADRVLARFKSDTTDAQRAAAITVERGRIVRTYSSVPGLVVIDLAPKPRVNLVVPQPGKDLQDGKDLMRRIQSLTDTGAFVFVEPDYVVHVSATPTDAAFANGTLWGLKNNGQNGGVAGADIQAEQAWDITTGDPTVIVGVVDTGIRYTHQDLAARMWTNPGEIAGNGIDDDGDFYVDNVYGINAILGTGDPMDDNDHGTHCAGTIGAQANGGGPHVGVAWNIRLMGLKFLDANGSGNTSDAVACVDFAVDEKGRLPAGVRMVLNNSWGGGGPSQALEDIIVAARDANILFVAAAGNESNNNDANPSYPANYNVDNVISVAAVDRSDGLAGFSNFGAATVHLGAPGVSIYSSTSGSNSEYQTFNGTSMATPHVSGVAALIWSAHPTASFAEVKQRLLVGAVPIPSLAGKTITGGRLNALNSLNVAPDGSLELTVTAEGGLQVLPNTTVPVRVTVTDFGPINDAVVTGTISTGGNLSFVNNGTGPDEVAGDNVYSTTVTVPSNVTSFSVNISATAPSKTPASAVVVFTVISPPPNDRFAQREMITSVPALRTGSNVNATSEPGEFDLDQNGQPGASIWWSWTAPQSGVAIATTDGSNIDTLLGVFTGSSVGTLSLVDVNDDITDAFTSSIVFQTQAGVTYHFHVDGYYAEQGAIQFNLSLNPSLPNDNFANRTVINGGVEFAVNGYNLGASGEPNEPSHNFYTPYRSVWWEWNNTDYAGPVYISTAGSSFDTHIAVYTGTGYQDLVWLAGNDDVLYEWPYYAILSSEVQFTAQIGRRYQIVVDSAQPETGTIRLTIARAPDNDQFNSARVLTGEFAQDYGNNIGATRQSGEPDYGSPALSAKTVWWRWTAPRSGNVVVTTDGSAFDTRIEVFTGTSINSLTSVGFNEDRSSRVYTSLLNFAAVQGTTYNIRVDGYYLEVPDGVGGIAAHWVFSGSINLLLSMDGASQLGPPEVRDDNTLSFNFFGEPERPYILSSSANLTQWTPILTNTLVSRQILFSTPVVPGPHFYRAQPASLVGGK